MKLVVLGRDGTINQDSPDDIKNAHEWVPIKGALEAIARLNHAGWQVLVASNQPGLAQGLFNTEVLFAIHDKMQRQLAEYGGRIDGVLYCPHAPSEGCDCRKPGSGMLRAIAQRMQVDLAGVPVIGDSLSDLEAAADVGARPVLVRTGNGRATESALPQALAEVAVFGDLAAASAALIAARS